MGQYVTSEERIAVLESRVASMDKNIENIDAKLDLLLAFRNKGAGVFWLISAISGTGVIGVITWVIDNVRGTH